MRDTLIVRPLYGLMYLLRLLFLSGRVGAWLHNAFYYAVGSPIARQPQERRWFKAIWSSIAQGNDAVFAWQRRIYTSTPTSWQHALECTFLRKRLLGTIRRRRLHRQGHTVPVMVMVSPNTPSSGCNLTCAHCYADSHEPALLPRDVFEKVLREQEELGIYSVFVSGGEPFLYKGIWEAFAAHPHTTFYVPTNGTQITEAAIRQLCELGNVCLMFSLEGFRGETDRIRGRGVFDQVLKAMALCRVHRLPYAVTATVTRQNFEVVTSELFLQLLDDHRCCAVNYSNYVAVGANPHPEWEITPEQSEGLDQVGEHMRRTYAMVPSIGRNGTARVSQCFAGRQYFHVLADGRVEGCPFVHWADPNLNVRECTILEITASPFFQSLRTVADQAMPGFTPCRAGKYPAMKGLFEKQGAQSTHEPRRVQWVLKTGTN